MLSRRFIRHYTGGNGTIQATGNQVLLHAFIKDAAGVLQNGAGTAAIAAGVNVGDFGEHGVLLDGLILASAGAGVNSITYSIVKGS